MQKATGATARWAIGLLAGALAATPAVAQQRDNPVIAGYGSTVAMAGAEMHPDPALRYRVLFNVTRGADDPDHPAPALVKMARFLNLLGADGIRPQPGDVVAIVHGGATPVVASDAVYKAKTGAAQNPNLPLIAKLRDAGVTVAVCSQALNGNHIDPGDVADGVRIDVSALTTMATLQLRGWALIPD